MELYIILGIAIIGLIAVLVYYAPGRRAQRREKALRAQFRQMTHGDTGLMQRLVRLEKERAPNISSSEALKRAIDRWKLERK